MFPASSAAAAAVAAAAAAAALPSAAGGAGKGGAAAEPAPGAPADAAAAAAAGAPSSLLPASAAGGSAASSTQQQLLPGFFALPSGAYATYASQNSTNQTISSSSGGGSGSGSAVPFGGSGELFSPAISGLPGPSGGSAAGPGPGALLPPGTLRGPGGGVTDAAQQPHHSAMPGGSWGGSTGPRAGGVSSSSSGAAAVPVPSAVKLVVGGVGPIGASSVASLHDGAAGRAGGRSRAPRDERVGRGRGQVWARWSHAPLPQRSEPIVVARRCECCGGRSRGDSSSRCSVIVCGLVHRPLFLPYPRRREGAAPRCARVHVRRHIQHGVQRG